MSDISRPAGGSISPSIVFDQVSLNFGDTLIFKEFNLDIEGGKCTCILGPSGCGKSTLLNMISARPETRFKGRIHIASQLPRSKLCSWMSQNDLLLPWMSVIDNVLLGAKLRNEVTKLLQTKAESLLIQIGLQEHIESLPSVLSGGMRQRVALLRTLMEDRPILLMDEPFSSLDALTRMKLQDLSAEMTAQKTVVLVTHDPMEALRLGDKIVVLGGIPGKAVTCLQPGGNVPRNAESAIISRYYPQLLNELLSPTCQPNSSSFSADIL